MIFLCPFLPLLPQFQLFNNDMHHKSICIFEKKDSSSRISILMIWVFSVTSFAGATSMTSASVGGPKKGQQEWAQNVESGVG